MLLAQESGNFEDEWAPALDIVQKLLNRHNVSKSEWHDLFAINNRITSWVPNGSTLLLRALEEVLRNHVRIHENTSDSDLLRVYVHEWSNYAVLIEHLPTPFAFIERGVSRPQNGISRVEGRHAETMFTVRNVMFSLWNGHVFETIYQRLLRAATHLISEERAGSAKCVKSELVIGIRESFVNAGHGTSEPLELYRRYFESQYIENLEAFYKEQTVHVLEQNGILKYMAYAFEKLNEEEDRAKKYLDESSFDRLISASVKVLVVQFQDQLLAEGPGLIKQNEVPRLRMLFGLVNKTDNGVKPLLDSLAKHIKAEGLSSMVANAENIVNDSEKYVEALLEMFDRFSGLVKEAFCNDSRFLTVRDMSFQEVVNSTDVFKLELVANKQRAARLPPESKCPELLANYCDLLLRKSALSKRLTSEQIDESLNKVLLLLKYVNNKDVFMRYHKNHLSRRLILELSADQEKEENLVKMFRDNGMPTDYVNKLYRMLQDIEVNKDLSAAFKKSIGANNNYRNAAESINLKILNAGAWSRGREKCHVSLPREIDEIIPEVEEFYKRKHVGRKLQWVHSWSTGVVAFANESGKFDLEVSAYQMAVLFAWNERPKERLSYEALRLATELSDPDLRRTLGSLLMNPKVRVQVLLTERDGMNPKHFTDSTMFWVNQTFAVVKPRGRINLVNRLVMNQDTGAEEEHEDIVRLREFRTQEAVMKILKTNRAMLQNDLQNKLVDMLKHMFVPSRKMIKEQLEWLIEQQFIGRDPNDINKFVYTT